MRIADDVLSPFPSLSTIFRFPALQALAAGFSAPAAGGSIFGATAADDSIFGGNPAAGGSSIGAPAAGGSIFGASAISFNFGATAADGSIFGAAPAAGGFSFGAAPAAGGFSIGAPATQTNTATDVARSVRGPSGGGGAKVAQSSSFFHRTTKNASSSPAFNPLSPSPPFSLSLFPRAEHDEPLVFPLPPLSLSALRQRRRRPKRNPSMWPQRSK